MAEQRDEFIDAIFRRDPSQNKLILKDKEEYPANILFNSRIDYKEKAFSWITNDRHQEILVDQTFQRPFFGRVDSKGNAIFPDQKFLKQIVPTSNTILLAQNFVTDSFTNMRNVYIRGIGISHNNEAPFSNLQPNKALVSIHKQYADFLTELNKEFIQYVYGNSLNKINNVNDLIVYFKNYLILKNKTVTRTNFILSQKADPFIGGFSISLATDDNNNDLNKYNTYITDNNFSFFLSMCYKFGFTVDKSFPWVIHYNFNYGDFLNVIKRYDTPEIKITSYEDLIEKRFYKTFYTDIKILKDFILYAYNSLLTNEQYSYIIDAVDKCDVLTVRTKIKESVSKKSLEAKYDNLFWLKYYLDIRIIEENIKVDLKTYNIVTDKISKYNQYFSFTKALEYVNYFIIHNKNKNQAEDIDSY